MCRNMMTHKNVISQHVKQSTYEKSHHTEKNRSIDCFYGDEGMLRYMILIPSRLSFSTLNLSVALSIDLHVCGCKLMSVFIFNIHN